MDFFFFFYWNTYFCVLRIWPIDLHIVNNLRFDGQNNVCNHITEMIRISQQSE